MNKIAKEIYYITNVRLPTHRAHGLQIMKSCEAFADNGITVKLIVPRLRPTYSGDPFTYYGVARTFSLHHMPVLELVPFEKWFGRWLGYVQNLSFSICALTHILLRGWLKSDSIFYTRDYMTAFLIVLLGLKPIFELHDYRSPKPRWRIDFILHKSRLIIVNSVGTLKALQTHYHVDKNRLLVAPNGVDLEFFNISQSRDETREILGLPHNTTIIGYVGSLETVGSEKGISTLLKAFSLIIDKQPNIFLLIVGGPTHMADRYIEEARIIGIPENKVSFRGQVVYRDIPGYLRTIDLAVIPLPRSQYADTTSPIKLFEYMAAGKTIIASDLPSLSLYLNEQNSELFEPSNPIDLAKHLQVVMDNQDRALSLASHALSNAAKYTWEARANLILNSIPWKIK